MKENKGKRLCHIITVIVLILLYAISNIPHATNLLITLIFISGIYFLLYSFIYEYFIDVNKKVKDDDMS